MFLTVLALSAFLFAALPAGIYWHNRRLYLPPPAPPPGTPPPEVSVLIPARNEEQTIRQAVSAALASRGVVVEVLVLDDHSEDRTAALVSELAQRDTRLRLLPGPELPAGWCGKQHACWVLAQQARYDLLCFQDADVRLAPDGLARLATFLEHSGADLVSGFPRQEMHTWSERLLIPLIHFILLGFLPLGRMRRRNHPAYAAGCGQLFLVRRRSYFQAGGHAAIRATLHDGLQLPRCFRAAGKRTDLCDATSVACCRMYTCFRDLWHGLAKNAGEGLGAPALILWSSLLLLGGQVLPVGLLLATPWLPPAARFFTLLALLCSYFPRLAAVRRFHQPLTSALAHPLAVLLLVILQWYALLARLWGQPRRWKGRSYASPSPAR